VPSMTMLQNRSGVTSGYHAIRNHPDSPHTSLQLQAAWSQDRGSSLGCQAFLLYPDVRRVCCRATPALFEHECCFEHAPYALCGIRRVKQQDPGYQSLCPRVPLFRELPNKNPVLLCQTQYGNQLMLYFALSCFIKFFEES